MQRKEHNWFDAERCFESHRFQNAGKTLCVSCGGFQNTCRTYIICKINLWKYIYNLRLKDSDLKYRQKICQIIYMSYPAVTGYGATKVFTIVIFIKYKHKPKGPKQHANNNV